VSDDGRYTETIRCRDAAGRSRALSVVTTRVGEVAIIVPPGGSATVTADQIEAVRIALAQARERVTRGRPT